MKPGPLAEPFLAHAGAARERLARIPELEQRLEQLLAAAKSAWPAIDLEPERFLQHVAERIPEDGDPDEALARLHAGDLYLAFACSISHAEALAAFEKQLMPALSDYLGRSQALASFGDDVKQRVRERLFVPRDGVIPKIASYSGRGPLAGWLRITATRMAIDVRRSQRSHGRETADVLSRVPSTSPDPELAYLKARYAREFRQAFTATLAALTTDDANLLRLYYIEEMSSQAIAQLRGVSARSVQRWLDAARQRIIDETRTLLRNELRVSDTEMDSLLGLVQSQLDVSICEALRRKA